MMLMCESIFTYGNYWQIDVLSYLFFTRNSFRESLLKLLLKEWLRTMPLRTSVTDKTTILSHDHPQHLLQQSHKFRKQCCGLRGNERSPLGFLFETLISRERLEISEWSLKHVIFSRWTAHCLDLDLESALFALWTWFFCMGRRIVGNMVCFKSHDFIVNSLLVMNIF